MRFRKTPSVDSEASPDIIKGGVVGCDGQRVWVRGVLLVLSLAAAGLVFLGTSLYGIGISPDSANYLCAARSLLAGDGYLCADGSPYAAWPPLFPTLLAVIGLAGIDPAIGARFLNAFAFGAIVFASGILFAGHLKSKALVVIATSSILLSVPLLSVSCMAWTEPVFILLVLLFTLYVPTFLRKHTASSLVTLAVLAALCSLQRYAGVTLTVTGAVIIAFGMRKASLSNRLKYLALFVAISCIPLAIWVTRNYVLTSMFTGYPRGPSRYSFVENRDFAVDLVTTWFLPESASLRIRRPIVGLAVCAVGTGWFFGRHRRKGQCEEGTSRVWPATLFVLIYIPFIMFVHQITVSVEPINSRYLAPALVFVLLSAFLVVDRMRIRLGSVFNRRGSPGLLIVGLCGLWLVYPVMHVHATVSDWMQNGAGGYTRTFWRESPLVNWLRSHPLKGGVYSNAPDALYVLAGMNARESPQASTDIAQFEKAVASEPNRYIVWCDNVQRSNLHDLEDLTSVLWIQEMTAFSDGAVYRLVVPADRAFPKGRALSNCLVNGIWSRTFTSDRFGARGVITSWVLRDDGTTDSVWKLNTSDGMVISWRPSCRYTYSEEAFEFRFAGEATEHGQGATSPYILRVHGRIDADVATGTYDIEFAGPQRPIDRDSGTWCVTLAWPVYRLQSATDDRHFYTIRRKEMKALIDQRSDKWTYRGIAWYAHPEGQLPPGARPVYHFQSRDLDTCFFTINESERDRLIGRNGDVWCYEGVAFYAFPEGRHPPDAKPVHRFWSATSKTHFYTASESERGELMTRLPHTWTYEGVAWYAVTNDHQ